MAGVEEFRAGAEPSDDLTVMIIRRCEQHSSQLAEKHFSLANRLEELSTFQSELEDFFDRNGLSETVAGELMLVCEELVVNTISYGYRDTLPHQIEVSMTLLPRESETAGPDAEPVYNAELIISLVDDGVAFNPLTAAKVGLGLPSDEAPIGGSGISLVLALSDAQDYQRIDGQNRLKICKMVVADSQ